MSDCIYSYMSYILLFNFVFYLSSILNYLLNNVGNVSFLINNPANINAIAVYTTKGGVSSKNNHAINIVHIGIRYDTWDINCTPVLRTRFIRISEAKAVGTNAKYTIVKNG